MPNDLYRHLKAGDSMAERLHYVVVGLLASGPIFFEVDPGFLSPFVLSSATLLVPYLVATYRLNHREAIRALLLGSSAALAIFSIDRKSTRLNSSHSQISYAVFCLKKK